MSTYIIKLQDIRKDMLSIAGGKAVNLGELFQLDGLEVPHGFCVTTTAYKKAISDHSRFNKLLDQLSSHQADDHVAIHKISAEIRNIIEQIQFPEDVANQVRQTLFNYSSSETYAVRSSATAEDLSRVSFAGQQETYLNVKGADEILQHILKCWASLFTEGAITYRIQNEFDHHKVSMGIIIQKMIPSEISGILFTADPMTSDRKTLSIEAGFGLGEALVSGLVDPNIYKVRDKKVIDKRIGIQDIEILPSSEGGTVRKELDTQRKSRQVLSDEQILILADIGRKIEAHFGYPQDIEWCYYNGQFQIVQSRPITTLFPIPESKNQKKPRVFMSVGHLQMMTDAIKPLGISLFEPLAQFSLDKAGGRVFADITHDLSSIIGRRRLIMATGKQDPLIQSAFKKLLENKNLIASLPKGKRNLKGGVFTISSIVESIKTLIKNDPSIIPKILGKFEEEINAIDQQLSNLSGEQVFEFIIKDQKNLIAMAYEPKMLGAIIASLLANDCLNKNFEKWFGEKKWQIS